MGESLEIFGIIPPRIGVIAHRIRLSFPSGTTWRPVFAQPPTQFHRLPQLEAEGRQGQDRLQPCALEQQRYR
jgi:hypothetical protein